jgi:oligopeptide/dipeptide ABC transporter ATP-binding protein
MSETVVSNSAAKATGAANAAYLEVQSLRVGVRRGGTELLLVDGVDFSMAQNDALGIVGESGSGKTMLCRSLLGTLPRYGAQVLGGQISIAGKQMAAADEATWRTVRGKDLGYVPQSSLAGLNPVLTIEAQLLEALRVGRQIGGKEARREAVELLEIVRIPRVQSVMGERSHQLSGGMRQRVMIAAALALRPPMLILDEPTTALDVTVQFEILTLIRSLRQELGMGVILVTHDLAVVEFLCDRVMTMYAGATVELGDAAAVRGRPRHPYTRALLESRLGMSARGSELRTIPGESPSVGSWPSGCRFSPRCPHATEVCSQGDQPELRTVSHLTACIHAEDAT